MQTAALIPLVIVASRVPVEKDAMTVKEYISQLAQLWRWPVQEKVVEEEALPSRSPVSVSEIDIELSPMRIDPTPKSLVP